MAKIEIRCPVCRKWNNIEISDDLTKNVSKGLLALNIATGMICEHSFIAYVDKNLIVRDCLVADFKIELQEKSSSQATDEIISPEMDVLKFDLIKLNLPDFLIVNVLRTIFLKKKILILSEEQFLYNHIINFFKYITHNTFEFDISIISEEDFWTFDAYCASEVTIGDQHFKLDGLMNKVIPDAVLNKKKELSFPIMISTITAQELMYSGCCILNIVVPAVMGALLGVDPEKASKMAAKGAWINNTVPGASERAFEVAKKALRIMKDLKD